MQNIIAAFDHADSAQRAYDQLRDAGLPAERLHLQLAPGEIFLAQPGPSEPQPVDPNDHHQGVLAALGTFFANLFDTHPDELGIYSDALRPGSSLLAVRALSQHEARDAAAVLRDCGASHVDQQVGQGPSDGTEAAAGGSRMRLVETEAGSEDNAPGSARL
ncbi:MAG TPA: hypothetical protein VLJ86_07920 [Ramlibacter sp.]|nr:hypothetical protein [Ramlibacter sp.]